MLARLQRWLVLGLLLGAAGFATFALGRGWGWPVALAGAVAIYFAHAWVLALEFAALGLVHPGAGIQRPAPATLLRAWWGEVFTGLRVFGWRQPFRAQQVPDHLPAAAQGRRGLLLVHGFVCNRGLWTPWLLRLTAADTPFVAVNLEPVFGSIDAYVPVVEQALARLEAATGLPPVVVAHSMGGLAVRAWLQQMQADARVHSVVTIGTPHQGTWLARFGLSPNTRQMRMQGPWLQALAAAEPHSRRALFTCYFGHCDNIVFPAANGSLPGADNRHLPGVAHVHLAFQPAVFNEVWRRLSPAAAG